MTVVVGMQTLPFLIFVPFSESFACQSCSRPVWPPLLVWSRKLQLFVPDLGDSLLCALPELRCVCQLYGRQYIEQRHWCCRMWRVSTTKGEKYYCLLIAHMLVNCIVIREVFFAFWAFNAVLYETTCVKFNRVHRVACNTPWEPWVFISLELINEVCE